MRWPWQDKLDEADRAVVQADLAHDRIQEIGSTVRNLVKVLEDIRAKNGFTRDAREAIQGVMRIAQEGQDGHDGK